ncbi:multiheme c-type cytochrome [Albimonas pacifica]|uniref:Doubled CXXCH domain-containing protein n=1 Tax=Albimonas pacifica TaxID=1114924 RepID=A0A1I3H3E9_9RHOB|nr:multiheme c-type cytochrome [Albimonas pacifica]SFI30219.1 doubled CXXCH domain-containing protein [Albimonas pacifica]
MRRLASPILVLLAALALSAGADAQEAGYVGSQSCAGCHRAEAEAWTGSHHDLAWTLPEEGRALGDFSGVEHDENGLAARFTTDPDGTPRIAVTEADGVRAAYRVRGVIGIAPLQQYVLETEPGRLQSFDLAWDAERGAWYHLYPDQDLPPGDGLHWTGPYKTWNSRCAECHATGYDKGYDPRSGRYASSQAEIGVGCEACHGPGRGHVDWAQGGQGTDPGFAVDVSQTGAAMEQCAGCHSRREAFLPGNPPPGTPYADAYSLALLRPGLYHADGQILDEVYVYGSFLQSKMHRKGVGCMDCHDPHAAQVKIEGDALCAQCHSPAGNPEFPSLPLVDFASAEHHFHPQDSDGARCVSCHMVSRDYMGIDGRRDHSFRIPRPDLAALTGAPDACTGCHADRDPAWAAAEIAARHPDAAARPHFGTTLARGRANAAASAGELAALALDPEQPGIARATALWLMEGAQDPEAARRALPLLSDPDPLVRAAAVGALRPLSAQESFAQLAVLLRDPARLVRQAAARAMLGAPVAYMPERTSTDLRAALGEWQGAMAARLDFPETHLQLGGFALTTRRFPAAAAAFAEATELDPQLIDAWHMRARIAAATEGAEAAQAILADALAANPGDPTLEDLMRQAGGRP